VNTSAASSAALMCPAANGAMVRGTNATDNRRSKVQWYDPWVGEGFGTGAGSLTLPLMTWGPGGMMFALDVEENGASLEIKGDCLRRVAVVGRRKVEAVLNFELVDKSRREGRTACLSIEVLASDAMLAVCVAMGRWSWLQDRTKLRGQSIEVMISAYGLFLIGARELRLRKRRKTTHAFEADH
jgi:hypothetical protein